MKVQATNQMFQAQFKLPVKIVTYYDKDGTKCSKNVNWVRIFTEPDAEMYYKRLLEAIKNNNIKEALLLREKMGKSRIVNMDIINLNTSKDKGLDIIG